MKRIIRRRKGYTLIELVLAMAVAAVLASCVSTLIGYAITMRRSADAQSAMYLASIRLHKAITTELAASSEVTAYVKGPNTFTKVPATERVMYVKNDKVVLGNKSSLNKDIIPQDAVFDSYNGVKVKSLTFQLVPIVDHLDAETETTSTLYRCVRVTTVLSKGSWEYEHTSVIRFEEMALNGTQIRVSSSTTSYDTKYIRDVQLGDTDAEYTFLRYSIE